MFSTQKETPPPVHNVCSRLVSFLSFAWSSSVLSGLKRVLSDQSTEEREALKWEGEGSQTVCQQGREVICLPLSHTTSLPRRAKRWQEKCSEGRQC